MVWYGAGVGAKWRGIRALHGVDVYACLPKRSDQDENAEKAKASYSFS